MTAVYDTQEFYRDYYYSGQDLGCNYQPEGTVVKVWAPLAEAMILRLFHSWEENTPFREISMIAGDRGVWSAELSGPMEGKYYTLEAVYQGHPTGQALDPYSRAVGPNGKKTFIFDPEKTIPPGWEMDRSPHLPRVTDSIIYELHVRDLSSHPSSGIRNRAQFLGLTEAGTKSPGGNSTGLDHLAELGITHLHLLPVFDFDEMDDLRYDPENYNWGYNPRNYNALKGAYSSNPRQPAQVIRDFRTMVQALHARGIRVVMDMVYNHTYASQDSNLNKIFPDYYYRTYEGHFSNGSGCGNELASERPMVRKMILDSLLYYAREFHLDGFRFDLMGLHDIDTMNLVSRELRELDPAMLIYGEGWTGGLSPLPDEHKALKANAGRTPDIAYFSDDMRDAIKGHVFDAHKPGFVNGGHEMEEPVKFGVVGGISHPQIDYSRLLYSHHPWATGPHQAINYAAAHDNHTLWDKLVHTLPKATEAERIRAHILANVIVFTSQGIPFLHAGEEFLRTKQGEENSYNSPDRINSLDWTRKDEYLWVNQYYQGLIALRQAHPAFRLGNQEDVRAHLRFLELAEPRMVAFTLNHHAGGDPCERLMVIYNGHNRAREVHLPYGNWQILLDDKRAGTESLGVPKNHMVKLPGVSAMVLGVFSQK